MTKSLASLIAIVLFAGCAATPYQRIGISSEGGYSSSRIASDRYSVMFTGNDNTKLAQAYDYTLLRCAELTIESGNTVFVIEAERDMAPTIVGFGSAMRGRPRYSIVISCYATAEKASGKIYNAVDVVREIKTKYGIK